MKKILGKEGKRIIKEIRCSIKCKDCKYFSVYNPNYEIDDDKKIKICEKYDMEIDNDDAD